MQPYFNANNTRPPAKINDYTLYYFFGFISILIVIVVLVFFFNRKRRRDVQVETDETQVRKGRRPP
jgi:cytochrome c-type biogenesis protein CcmH/NrfF